MWLACSRFCCYCLAVALISTGELKCRVIMPFTNPRLAYVSWNQVHNSIRTNITPAINSFVIASSSDQQCSIDGRSCRAAPERDRVVGFVLADRYWL